MRIKEKIIKSALAVLALSVFFVCEQNVAAAVIPTQIDSFDSVIRLNPDASVDITETIEYDFGSQPAFYISHKIPIRYILSDRGGRRYTLHLGDVSVADADGRLYEFVVLDSGGSKELKIGSKGVTMAGKNSFVVRYHLEYPVNFADGHDEFFWNVTSDDWTVPIAKASARVIYPAEIKAADAGIECYAGRMGSRKDCDRAEYVFADEQNRAVSAAEFSASDLAAGEGMTFFATLPKGAMREPGILDYLGWIVDDFLASLAADGWVLVFPFLILVRMLLIWRKQGRDPEGKETIIPEYDIPDGLAPAELGLILDEECGQKEIVAEMVLLSQKGYLGIEKLENGDYVFRKLKDPKSLEDEFDREILYGLFQGRDVMKFSDLKGRFFSAYGRVVDLLFESVYEKGYFADNPRKVMHRYSAWAILLAFGLMFVFSLLGDMQESGIELPFSSNFFFWAVSAVILSIVVIVKLSRMMPKKTGKGVAVREHILGFREYLRVAEKERLEFHDAPAPGAQDFEKFLPYAVALGVENEWTKQFEGLYETPSSHRRKRRGIGCVWHQRGS